MDSLSKLLAVYQVDTDGRGIIFIFMARLFFDMQKLEQYGL